MANWNLGQIRNKVRSVTGRYSPNDLSNNDIDEAINRYLQFTFPAELKLERQHTYYERILSENQPTYDLENDIATNLEPVGTVDNLYLTWYQDPSRFQQENVYNVSRANQPGTGITGPYNFTTAGTPILPGSIIISDGVETFEDTNKTYTSTTFNITGSASGTATVNYSTGSISVSFFAAVPTSTTIYLSYIVFVPGRPTAVLMYNNQLEFYPPPDNSAYRFRAKAYGLYLVTKVDGTKALTFETSTDQPNLEQWGPCIAYGASLYIHEDLKEFEAYQITQQFYKKELAYVLRKTNQDLLNQRAMPNF